MAQVTLRFRVEWPWWFGLVMWCACWWSVAGLPFDDDAFAAWLADKCVELDS